MPSFVTSRSLPQCFRLRGGLQRLADRIGRTRAPRIAMFGDSISASDAFGLGFVSHLVPTDRLRQEVDALARQMATGPTRAYGAMRAMSLRTKPLQRPTHQLPPRRMRMSSRSEPARLTPSSAPLLAKPPTHTPRDACPSSTSFSAMVHARPWRPASLVLQGWRARIFPGVNCPFPRGLRSPPQSVRRSRAARAPRSSAQCTKWPTKSAPSKPGLRRCTPRKP
jgi:hypothetical protein